MSAQSYFEWILAVRDYNVLYRLLQEEKWLVAATSYALLLTLWAVVKVRPLSKATKWFLTGTLAILTTTVFTLDGNNSSLPVAIAVSVGALLPIAGMGWYAAVAYNLAWSRTQTVQAILGCLTLAAVMLTSSVRLLCDYLIAADGSYDVRWYNTQMTLWLVVQALVAVLLLTLLVQGYERLRDWLDYRWAEKMLNSPQHADNEPLPVSTYANQADFEAVHNGDGNKH